jgi:hypothetical protein
MEKEIKFPSLSEPKFFQESYDYRNKENAGQYRGVGERGKVGTHATSSIDAMPPLKKEMRVPRDHQG